MEPFSNKENFVFVRVENRGSTNADNACHLYKAGAFVPPKLVAPATGLDVSGMPLMSKVSGNSPTGRTKVVVTLAPSGTQVVDVSLQRDTGATIVGFGAIASGHQAGWGFSPDGRYFVYASTVSAQATVYVAEKLAGETKAPGTQKCSAFFGTGGSTAGWGFSPDGGTFLAATSFSIVGYDLLSGLKLFDTPTFQWSQFRFSPAGDLCMLVGNTAGEAVRFEQTAAFYTSPGTLQPTAANVPVQVTVGAGSTIGAVAVGSGTNGIKLTGMLPPFIDNPLCRTVPTSATVEVFTTTPTGNGTRGQSKSLGTAHANIPAGTSRQILLPTWKDAVNGHQCLIAEAFTLAPSGDPHPGRQQDFLVLARRQVAQRNVVVTRSSSPFLAPLRVHNPGPGSVTSTVSVERVEAWDPSWQDHPALAAVPRQQFTSERHGLIEYRCGQRLPERPETVTVMKRRLTPGESLSLALWFDNPFEGQDVEAAQIFTVTEERDGELLGGVLVVGLATSRTLEVPLPVPDGRSPLKLTGLKLDADRLIAATLAHHERRPLEEVSVYLECTSEPLARASPLTHRFGTLEPGLHVTAEWPIDLTSVPTGQIGVSLVVEDAHHAYQRFYRHITYGRENS
ncbi:unnamed protein product [[Actinomadura] parvosata subsp. kistnae]|uniref:Uncharacterized protein n=2 Tax=Nonomuraea TaxID=83681 RepID=A0A1U9ZYA4_9ACTN|nr:hypothetical protein BKM31_17015 [Nonomuraea sp. ATCC 55076]SPL95830.1 unnamed protein product [Actinomadura parvosata subsp. kistnae]